ncbi:putative disease resistance RPP13-like protein 1 [Argentina anserina]|uniref:putative disease resistance RPP13-like protein 1 n=1 Tax=Argentina anserina TaxID=57926 RepID=UPI0021762B0C|nr:putative disease resistance RPP13-like protein 1 [Potentilla anserina]
MKLPRAMSRLYNLQTLRLVGCLGLQKIDVTMLINLRHLYVDDSLGLIKGIGNLTDLQTLDGFYVPFWGDEANKLEDLKDLNQLRSLSILILGKSIVVEKSSIMVNKARLLRLELQFYCPDRPREVMDGLEPPPGLESLIIRWYGGGAFSDWLWSLHCLRVLTLRLCHCGFLPPLGKLASLESLNIECLSKVEKVGVEFLGIEEAQTSSSSSIFTSFPKLREFTIFRMESLQEWEEENSVNITIMPCLSHLTITWCKELKALPEFLWKTPLQKLNIWGSPFLQALYKQGEGEEWAKISHIPSIQIEED